MLYQLHEDHLAFPPLHFALKEPNGLLALGGDLSPKRLIKAYQQGIFPWYSEGDPLMWWSPCPRAIININNLRINRTLRKALNKSPYKITLNTAFNQVIQLCANAPFRDDETWILPEMGRAYGELHKQGYAHSIEVWQHDMANDEKILVGGLYGIAINGFFSGESMFYTAPNASKFALVALSQLLKALDVTFIDCQLINPFLASMGATEVSRNDFVKQKDIALTKVVPKNFWHSRELSIQFSPNEQT